MPANKKKKTIDKNKLTEPRIPVADPQPISVAQDWRNRMASAKVSLPKKYGQMKVIEYIVEKEPALNKLTNYSRWHNAWHCRVADPQITELVEDAVGHFTNRKLDDEMAKMIKRQGLTKKY